MVIAVRWRAEPRQLWPWPRTPVQQPSSPLAPQPLLSSLGVAAPLLVETDSQILEVVALAEKRGSAAVAEQLYVDHSPPPPERKPKDAFELGMQVERGSGRPSKRDRRRYDSLKGW